MCVRAHAGGVHCTMCTASALRVRTCVCVCVRMQGGALHHVHSFNTDQLEGLADALGRQSLLWRRTYAAAPSAPAPFRSSSSAEGGSGSSSGVGATSAEPSAPEASTYQRQKPILLPLQQQQLQQQGQRQLQEKQLQEQDAPAHLYAALCAAVHRRLLQRAPTLSAKGLALTLYSCAQAAAAAAAHAPTAPFRLQETPAQAHSLRGADAVGASSAHTPLAGVPTRSTFGTRPTHAKVLQGGEGREGGQLSAWEGVDEEQDEWRCAERVLQLLVARISAFAQPHLQQRHPQQGGWAELPPEDLSTLMDALVLLTQAASTPPSASWHRQLYVADSLQGDCGLVLAHVLLPQTQAAAGAKSRDVSGAALDVAPPPLY